VRPPADILDRLVGFRLLAGGPAELSVRQGERRSSAKGTGMEFAGNRPYREGDDLRHLDARLYARYRKPYLRERFADRQLRVAILVDTSPSMAFGTPSKRATAGMLAALLGAAALASGDLVEIGMARGRLMDWSEALQGSLRAETLFRWLDRPGAETTLDFAQQLRLAQPRLEAANLDILIGDWWLEDPEIALRPLGGLGGAVRAVQVLAPEEEDPLLLGRGPQRLRDSEGAGELDVLIDKQSAADYAALLTQHRESIAQALRRVRGRLTALRADSPPGEIFAQLVHERLLGQIGVIRAA
jgi:uncharacterized protein (DUF58 family)